MLLAQCLQDITVTHGLPITLFMAGAVGGFTHCTLMCSPFVLAQCGKRCGALSNKDCDDMSQGQVVAIKEKRVNNQTASDVFVARMKASLLLPYHFGRMTTYVSMAMVMNMMINLAFWFSDSKALLAAPMLALAGVMFIVSAFPRLSMLFPWGGNINLGLPYNWLSLPLSKLVTKRDIVSQYLRGVLLGFMPCGLVISALLAAATAPDVMGAGFAMMAFSLGTIPALFMVALGGQTFSHKYPRTSLHMSRGAMVLSALWLFALAGTMIL